MRYSLVTSAGDGRVNEDLVALHERDGITDIVVMDGATPLTPERHVDAPGSDPAWFVRQFGADLAAVLVADASQESMVQRALAATRAAFRRRATGAAPEPYAWPIATLSWMRIRHGGGAERASERGMDGAHALELYCLGDSRILLREEGGAVRDLDPFENPAEKQVQAAVAALVAEGVDDAGARWERLLPMLKARRHEQNTAARPQVLCLEPRGAFAARTARMPLPSGAMLVAMTDGFYRLVDTYGLYSDAGLLEACRRHGLDALVDRLRAFEAGGAAAGLAAKRADDASAVAWRAA